MIETSPAKEIRVYVDPDELEESEEYTERTYEITIVDETLHDVFLSYWMADQERHEHAGAFKKRIGELGHAVTGSNNDDDYEDLASQTLHIGGRYFGDDAAKILARSYLEAAKLSRMLWRNSIVAFGFVEKYKEWLVKEGLGERNAYGGVRPFYPPVKEYDD